MNIVTCKQLGGACDEPFYAGSFDEMAEFSKQHGMDMFQKKDATHVNAMNDMQALMNQPDAMREWFENKKREFDALPDL